jgi:hypothetical protein
MKLASSSLASLFACRIARAVQLLRLMHTVRRHRHDARECFGVDGDHHETRMRNPPTVATPATCSCFEDRRISVTPAASQRAA